MIRILLAAAAFLAVPFVVPAPVLAAIPHVDKPTALLVYSGHAAKANPATLQKAAKQANTLMAAGYSISLLNLDTLGKSAWQHKWFTKGAPIYAVFDDAASGELAKEQPTPSQYTATRFLSTLSTAPAPLPEVESWLRQHGVYNAATFKRRDLAVLHGELEAAGTDAPKIIALRKKYLGEFVTVRAYVIAVCPFTHGGGAYKIAAKPDDGHFDGHWAHMKNFDPAIPLGSEIVASGYIKDLDPLGFLFERCAYSVVTKETEKESRTWIAN